jgi:hypothetical protein
MLAPICRGGGIIGPLLDTVNAVPKVVGVAARCMRSGGGGEDGRGGGASCVVVAVLLSGIKDGGGILPGGGGCLGGGGRAIIGGFDRSTGGGSPPDEILDRLVTSSTAESRDCLTSDCALRGRTPNVAVESLTTLECGAATTKGIVEFEGIACDEEEGGGGAMNWNC